jgi:chloramphenicol 3-O phosphotransferase
VQLDKVLPAAIITGGGKACLLNKQEDIMHMTPRQILHDDFDNQLLITQGIMHETIKLFSDKGFSVIVDDVVLDLPEKNDWLYEYVTMFQDYPVLFVHVHCPLHELERGEIQRGDRNIGQARWQLEHMDNSIQYDLVMDTYENTTEQCADIILSLLEKPNEWIAFKQNKLTLDLTRQN